VRHQAKIRGSSDSLRKSGSQETPRWSKPDSNRRYRVTRPGLRERPMPASGTDGSNPSPSSRESTANLVSGHMIIATEGSALSHGAADHGLDRAYLAEPRAPPFSRSYGSRRLFQNVGFEVEVIRLEKRPRGLCRSRRQKRVLALDPILDPNAPIRVGTSRERNERHRLAMGVGRDRPAS
jgi:hypothetical protein